MFKMLLEYNGEVLVNGDRTLSVSHFWKPWEYNFDLPKENQKEKKEEENLFKKVVVISATKSPRT